MSSRPSPSELPDLSSSDDHKQENTTTRFPLPTWENFPPLPPQFTQAFTPGNVLFVSSFPFCYRAYRDYHTYTQRMVQTRIAANGSTAVPDNKLGMMVASRALGIATRGSVGLFALTGSFFFFLNGWSSLADAVQATQQWAQSRRQRLITVLGLPDNNNSDHPDLVATKHMTDEQALDYLSKKYFVSQEEEEEEEPGAESDHEKGP